MTLNFPNCSRSYDATRQAVRFWGHYSAMEVSFFVMAEALIQLRPGTTWDETSLLNAFDQHRDRICTIAAKMFARRDRKSYDLLSSDF